MPSTVSLPNQVANGVSLYYERAGKGEETIVFLNGIGMTVSMWAPYVCRFSDRYQTLCHDFRGQLMSEKPEGPYSMELHAQDVIALLDALGIEKAHWVGTSYGSEVAQILACTYPDRTRTLSVVTGVSELDTMLRTTALTWQSAAQSGDGVAFFRALLPWTYSPAYIEANWDFFESRAAALVLGYVESHLLPLDFRLCLEAPGRSRWKRLPEPCTLPPAPSGCS